MITETWWIQKGVCNLNNFFADNPQETLKKKMFEFVVLVFKVSAAGAGFKLSLEV